VFCTPSAVDVDKNGKLSRQELKDILTRMDNNDGATIRKFDEAEADEIIDDFIKNNDGQELSVQEYIKAMRKFVPIK
jgi:Ca2+-binding EF-hand superfamily protein